MPEADGAPGFAEDPPRRGAPAEFHPDTLVVSLAGFEGPLDLLLTLARNQRIDLAAIPILPLVDQYLAFIAEARQLRIEVAADHLVMAAWLAYLKSALLLPREAMPDPDPEELAERLRWRLLRLDAMRKAADSLVARDLLGRDVFARGAPEGLRQVRTSRLHATLYDLIATYGAIAARGANSPWAPPPRAVITLEEALDQLSRLIGRAVDWTELQRFLPEGLAPAMTASALASSFVAALELARTGRAELSQADAFGPLMLRAKA